MPAITIIQGKMEVGDYVKIKKQNTVGQILQIKGNNAEVAIGDLKSNLKLSRLEKISSKDYKAVAGTHSKSTTRLISSDLSEKLKHFDSTLDLRGKRVGETGGSDDKGSIPNPGALWNTFPGIGGQPAPDSPAAPPE